MKTKVFWLFCIVLLSSLSLAQSPQPARRTTKPWVLPSDISLARASQPSKMVASTSISSCNNNGVCEPQLGDSCTTCADCTGNFYCSLLKSICDRYNFVGGKPGPVYNECLNDTYSNLETYLEWFSQKYTAPGSNVVSDSSPLTPGDGKCNKSSPGGSCGGIPTETCYNDPADCGPCPTIANISDLNIATGACNPLMCSAGVCSPTDCGNTLACQYNCGSAHYGGTGGFTIQSDAVDFLVDNTTCPGMAALSDNLCGVAGTNYISYQQDITGTLHVGVGTRAGSFPASPDTSGVAGNTCPSLNGGPPSFRAWLAASAINNTLFTVGGGTCNTCSGFGGNEVPTVETYDTTSNTWYSKASLQAARFGASASTVNGKVYALGGTSGNQSFPIGTVEEYDPGADVWSVKTNMPTPRWKLTSSTFNGTIYAIGGGTSGNQCVPTGTVEAYNPIADAWTTKTSIPSAVWGAASDVLNGKIYVVGGSQECPQISVVVSAALEVYDPSTDTWAGKAPMPTPRWDLAAAAANGKLYAIGGWDPVNQKALDIVEQFDPATNSWTIKSHMPTARSGLIAAAINGKIYVFGGLNQFNQLLATLEIYDPSTDTWITAAPPPPLNPPAITLVSPNSGNQGATIPSFTVIGSNFDPAAVLSFGGTGITVNSYSSRTATQIVVNTSIASNATTGAYDVVVTNPDSQQGKLPAGFTVGAPPPPPTGTISVTTNLSAATFTITGPATFSGSGTSASFSNAPVGTYTITFGAVAGDITPSQQTQTLTAGGTVAFTGTYNPVTPPPPVALVFPVRGYTPYTAPIASVFDHTMVKPYANDTDGIVVAYTGDKGDSQNGPGVISATLGNATVTLNWTPTIGATNYTLTCSTSQSSAVCDGNTIFSGTRTTFIHSGLKNGMTYQYKLSILDNNGNTNSGLMVTAKPSVKDGTVLGTDSCDTFKQLNGTIFNFGNNGSYAGASTCGGQAYLSYEGHPGIDYRFNYATPVYPAVTGVVSYLDPAAGFTSPFAYHVLSIDPQNGSGYKVYYLHLSSYYDQTTGKVLKATLDGRCKPIVVECPECAQQGEHVDINRTLPIGYVGNFSANKWCAVSPHLHFEVDKIVGKSKTPEDPYGWIPTNQKDPYVPGSTFLWSQPLP